MENAPASIDWPGLIRCLRSGKRCRDALIAKEGDLGFRAHYALHARILEDLMKKRKGEDLIKERRAENRALAQRLQAAGCPVPAEDECSPQPDLTIEVCDPKQTRAYDFPSSAEYVFAVRVTNHSYARLEIQEFKCQLPWPDAMIWPRIDMNETKVYRLPSGRQFPCDTVLNHCIGELGKFEPGETREGLWLAFSPCRRIDADCLHGTPFPAQLSVFDQYGRRHRSLVEIVADRTATMKLPAFQQRRGKGLYNDGSEADTTRLVPATVHAIPMPGEPARSCERAGVNPSCFQ
jgi:hypothetical protein